MTNHMKTTSILANGTSIKLYEYVEDFYLVSKPANRALKQLRKGLPTWVSSNTYHKMNISLWIYDDTAVNAFSCHYNQKHYIALSIGLLSAFWEEANNFINQENLSLIFHLSESKKSYYINSLYFYMLNFTVAHEFGHIVHGHLKGKKDKHYIEELLRITTDTNSEEKKCQNWLTQLKEYDADSFAASIQTILFLQFWSDDIKINLASFDLMFISNYLCFRIFSEKTGRNFDEYFTKDIDEYDHPHPGIRMYYSFIHYFYWIGKFHGFNKDTIDILISGSDIVTRYEHIVLQKKELQKCYYSIAFTEKGAQHLMNLHNDWENLVEYYRHHSYIPIEKMEQINEMPILNFYKAHIKESTENER